MGRGEYILVFHLGVHSPQHQLKFVVHNTSFYNSAIYEICFFAQISAYY